MSYWEEGVKRDYLMMDVWYGGHGTDDPEAVRWIGSSAELLAASDFPIEAGPIKTTLHLLAKAGWVLRMKQRTPRHTMKTRPKVSITPPGNENFGFRWKLRARPYFKERWQVLHAIQQEPNVEKFSMTHFEVKRIDVPVADEALRKEIEGYSETVAGLKFSYNALINERDRLVIQKQDLQADNARLLDSNHRMHSAMIKLEREVEALRHGADALKVRVDDRVVKDTRYISEELAARILDENDRMSKLLSALKVSESAEALLAEYREDPFPLLREWTERLVSRLDFSRPGEPHEPVDFTNVIDLAEHLQQRASVEMDNELEERLSRAIGE